jgi:hypothetical protein
MQLAGARHSTSSIRANLNYIVDSGVAPVVYVDWPEMEHKATPPQYELREVEIRNGRLQRDLLELDIHGFAFVDHDTKVGDFADPSERKAVYDQEIVSLIKRCSGASEVVVFDHTIRVGDVRTRTTINARAPVKGVHNDYTENSAPRRLRQILGDAEAQKRLNQRFAIIQVWRPIRRKVLVDPLAICDARSIPEKGFVVLQRCYSDRTAEVYHIAYDPQHIWYHFPEMERHEALVFKVFDSDTTGRARFTAHTAFDDPHTPADTWPRESIETRTFAFFS